MKYAREGGSKAREAREAREGEEEEREEEGGVHEHA